MSGSNRKESKDPRRDVDYSAFVRLYPEYGKTSAIDELRRSQFSRLDEQGHVYLDYTGGGLYGVSQIQDHMDLLLNSVLGNPHSTNPSSLVATNLVQNCRGRILDFFRASPDE